MIDYPLNFPLPSIDFSGGFETPTIRTDIDNGITEQYGRFATGCETYNVSWKLSQDELSVFEEWHSETLAGGVLVFGLALPDDGAYSIQPVRFVGGQYDVSHNQALWFTVSAKVEKLTVSIAPTNRTLPVPQWSRIEVDPTDSQNLTLSHRNARLTVRPDEGSQTALRIYPPNSDTQYIYFGLNNQGDGETLITSEGVESLPLDGIPSWPGNLPNLNDAFTVSAKRRVNRVEMESGHTRQTLGAETTVASYNAEWTLTLEQLRTFQDFFYTTLKEGSLPFWLALPVDGLFDPVRVRFVGGKYDEEYTFHDTFKVSAQLDRIVDQTVTPSEDRPFPIYYSPTVLVNENTNIFDGAGKFFVCNPAEGKTVGLYICGLKIEFGLLNIGMGNVRIARAAFGKDSGQSLFAKPGMQLIDVTVDVPTTDATGSAFGKPVFEMRDTLIDTGPVADNAGAAFNKPNLEMLDVLEDVGSIPEQGASAFSKPEMQMLEVLKDVGNISENGTSLFNKPSFELIVP